MTTAIAPSKPKTVAPEAKATIPVLENGDRLDASEFLSRYAAMPNCKKAELIFGRVYVSPPVSIFGHGLPHAMMVGILFNYSAATQGIVVFDNGTIHLSESDMPQPDVGMFVDPKFGGRATFDEHDYIVAGLDFVAEIAKSSASYDLHDKLALYEQTGVPEYLVWRTYDEAFDYFRLIDGKYVRQQADDAGVFHSQVYPGLRIDAKALLQGNLATALATLQAGLASALPAEFLKTLKPKA